MAPRTPIQNAVLHRIPRESPSRTCHASRTHTHTRLDLGGLAFQIVAGAVGPLHGTHRPLDGHWKWGDFRECRRQALPGRTRKTQKLSNKKALLKQSNMLHMWTACEAEQAPKPRTYLRAGHSRCTMTCEVSCWQNRTARVTSTAGFLASRGPGRAAGTAKEVQMSEGMRGTKAGGHGWRHPDMCGNDGSAAREGRRGTQTREGGGRRSEMDGCGIEMEEKFCCGRRKPQVKQRKDMHGQVAKR